MLNKACILGCLMPNSDDPLRDLEVFELLMGMDDCSMAVRHGRIKPDEVARRVTGLSTSEWFVPNVEVDLTRWAGSKNTRCQKIIQKSLARPSGRAASRVHTSGHADFGNDSGQEWLRCPFCAASAGAKCINYSCAMKINIQRIRLFRNWMKYAPVIDPLSIGIPSRVWRSD